MQVSLLALLRFFVAADVCDVTLIDRSQGDVEELLHAALSSLASNGRFVAAFRSDDGCCLRLRVRRIAELVADRCEGNACRQAIAALHRLLADDGEHGEGLCGEQGPESRKRHASGEWLLATGASEEQLQRQSAVMRRLRAWEQVQGLRCLVCASARAGGSDAAARLCAGIPYRS